MIYNAQRHFSGEDAIEEEDPKKKKKKGRDSNMSITKARDTAGTLNSTIGNSTVGTGSGIGGFIEDGKDSKKKKNKKSAAKTRIQLW